MTGSRSTSCLGGELTEAVRAVRSKGGHMERIEGGGGRVTGKKIHSYIGRLLSICSSWEPQVVTINNVL